MRIAKVEAIPVAYPEPNDFNATRYLCPVKITTDDGIVGWGESITQRPEANPAVAAIIDGMAEVIIGRDPMHIEAIWHSMKDGSAEGLVDSGFSFTRPGWPWFSLGSRTRSAWAAPGRVGAACGDTSLRSLTRSRGEVRRVWPKFAGQGRSSAAS